MRGVALAIVLVVPLAAAADVSVGESGAERCLGAVRRALADDYPNEDGNEEHYCRRTPGELDCRGSCDDRSCHNDACESWSSRIDIELTPAAGAPTTWARRPDGEGSWIYQRRVGATDVHIRIHSTRRDEFAHQLAEEVRAHAARARRVLDACLAQ